MHVEAQKASAVKLVESMAVSGARNERGEVRIHESLDELSTDLAYHIAELSEASVKERGVFAIALSGGSLVGLMGKLCEPPYNKTVDWAKWYIFWADERVVAKNHADSNYKLAKDGLLSKACLLLLCGPNVLDIPLPFDCIPVLRHNGLPTKKQEEIGYILEITMRGVLKIMRG